MHYGNCDVENKMQQRLEHIAGDIFCIAVVVWR